MKKVLQFFQAILLVMWLGGMIFFSFIVAPSAFKVLPTRQLAGSLVAEILQKSNFISYVVLVLFILLCLLTRILQKQKWSAPQRFLVLLASVALVISLYSKFGVEPRLHTLRIETGAIDARAVDDPLRREFDRLHQRSVTLFGINLSVGLLMLGVWVKAQ